jgi:hypothetical protein
LSLLVISRSPRNPLVNAQWCGFAGSGLTADFPPGFLLGLVLHIATGWAVVSPEYAAAIDVPDLDDRVRFIEDAVRALVSGPGQLDTGSR